MDETLKAQLQELMSNLGLDLTTFFYNGCKTSCEGTGITVST